MRSTAQYLWTRGASASHQLRSILCSVFAMVAIGTDVAQAQELTREIYAPATEKGPAIVVVSGGFGTAAYRQY